MSVSAKPESASDTPNLVVNGSTGQIELEPEYRKFNREVAMRVAAEYTPVGFCTNLEGYVRDQVKTYDAIITQITSEDASVDEFFDNCGYLRETLTDNGVLAIICPSDLSYAIIEELEKNVSAGEKLCLRPLIDTPLTKYAKPMITYLNTSVRSPFMPPQDCLHLLTFTREDNTPMREYSLQVPNIHSPHENVINIFCDRGERFLDPFSLGFLPCSAKRSGRKCDYLISDQALLDRAIKAAGSTVFPNYLFEEG